jgi:hypothetical protein
MFCAFAAVVHLVHFHDAHELLEIRVFQGSPEPMAHIPSGLVCAASDLPLDLKGADALLTVQHCPENLKPNGKRVLRILENGIDQNGEPIGRIPAVLADPVKRLPVQHADLGIAATRAFHGAIRPAALFQELLAGRFIGEPFHQLFERHHA